VDGPGEGFVDTAALMTCLDLVVCVDTAAGHLTGALGVPAWLALSAVANWRWLRDREDTPWYSSLRLFRQRRLGKWGAVFGWMADNLRRRVYARRQAGSSGAAD
jgi:ADP-heptose:LPS heptosyltransferase